MHCALGGGYDCVFGEGVLSKVGQLLQKNCQPSKVLIVTDDGIPNEYLNTVKVSFKEVGIFADSLILPQGEESKSLDCFKKIIDCLTSGGFDRNSLIVALGGGMIGDLSGFVASVYLRGVKWVCLPTTLLAMTDSSIGGKTAINYLGYKNYVGSFYQPSLVVADYTVLKTLPKKELLSGMGEVIKYGILVGGKLWEEIKNHGDLYQIIAECIRYKVHVAVKDERDNGLRKILNLGHTIGHAEEEFSGFSVSHGQCVVKGIIAVLNYCTLKGLCKEETKIEIISVVESYAFDYGLNIKRDQLVKFLIKDKKVFGNKITIAVIKGIGDVVLKEVFLDNLEEII